MNEFISVEEARERICARLVAVGLERVFLGEASGRVLGEAIAAPWNQPRFSHSARDGFALRFEDLIGPETRLELVGQSAAGAESDFRVEKGQAARITTGAPLPPGADTVVMQEDCEFDPAASTVTVPARATTARGAWVRQVGEDMAEGQAILTPGMRLGAAEIALLAGFGHSLVTVARKPRVAIVSTGDELVDPGTSPGPSQIVNTNAYLLAALVTEFGGEPRILPIAPDDETAIRRAFSSAARNSDLVLSSGGVSVGDFDLTRPIVDELTGGMDFWKIRMKPGKPLAFGILRGSERSAEGFQRPLGLLGLPGNPNACLVCFHQFVRPAMAILQGRALNDTSPTPALPVSFQARLGADVTTTPRRRVYLSGRLEPTKSGESSEPTPPVFYPAKNQNSGNLRLFCQANAFGIVDEGISELRAGDMIRVEKL